VRIITHHAVWTYEEVNRKECNILDDDLRRVIRVAQRKCDVE